MLLPCTCQCHEHQEGPNGDQGTIPDAAASKATFDYTEEPLLVELWRDQLRTALQASMPVSNEIRRYSISSTECETGMQRIRIKGIAEGANLAANYIEHDGDQ